MILDNLSDDRSYDLLSKLIQTNINNKTDLIVDVGIKNHNESNYSNYIWPGIV